MEPFSRHRGLVGPMDRANVDTDMIIPKQFLKSIKKTGFGPNLFDELRYLDQGSQGSNPQEREENPDFALNNDRYIGSSILLTRNNFGCGSSREHAPWALKDFGFRAIIASSFADIFYNNCFKNGLLPIVLHEDLIDKLFTQLYCEVGFSMSIDLRLQRVLLDDGRSFTFQIDQFYKNCLLEGLDEIDVTLRDKEAITRYEMERKKLHPWIFGAIK
ncbi:MAG: 3-isopropylmalate dehydratase small subunit [Porticoccaceae bacterium]|nr:3-isopropylmalate dehydratase small subunit [Porticoccaceae bacterium]|tara:strand:- start:6137 stop:6784 length:648 start_codon:yes stop_codon:yes gene_type:complete